MTVFGHCGVQLSSEVESALIMQQGQIAEDVRLNFLGLGLGINQLQVLDDLLYGVLAIATLDYFEARAVEPQCAFGHEQHPLIVVVTQATAGRKARMRLPVGSHTKIISGDWYSCQ
jgi:hypothetical protein